MLVLRGYGLSGLGQGDTPTLPATTPLTSGYCFDGGMWKWATAAQCSKPLLPGGPPEPRPGFCWIRQSPPDAFPGYWQRPRAGQACAYEPPPSAPKVPAGFCQNPTTGQWEWVLADQCAGPVQAGQAYERQHVKEAPNQLDVVNGTMATRGRVDRLFEATWKQYREREALAVKAFTLTLAPCPAEAVKPPMCVGCGPSCYTHGAATMAETIPGGFELWGVPFNIAEVGITKSPQFERSYMPNNEQRILIEGMIIRRSNDLRDATLAATIRARTNISGVEAFIARLSVQSVLNYLPRWQPTVFGMAFRSLPPKPEELTQEGGYVAWLKRGGFLISIDVAEGKTRLSDEATCPRVCIGNLCRCGENATPACVGAGVPVSADPNLPTGCFWWSVEIDAVGQFRLIGRHDDPSWLQRAAAKMAAFMVELGNFTCGNAPALQGQMQATVAEKCVDKDGKPCTKGAVGCSCITPSAAAVGGVGIFNFAAAKLCQGWIAEHTQNPTQTLPPVPDPPPLSKWLAWRKLLPWIVGGLAAGGAGAVAFRR